VAAAINTSSAQDGSNRRLEEIATWPEVQTAGLSDAAEVDGRVRFHAQLVETYNKAFASVAPPSTTSLAASTVSAGEAVQRDEKARCLSGFHNSDNHLI
jgi:hypothetical protein